MNACLSLNAREDGFETVRAKRYAMKILAQVWFDSAVVLAWDAPSSDAGSVTGYEIPRRRYE